MIRRMQAGDVAAVAELEAQSFSSPWHPSTFLRLLDRPGAELWVLEEGGEVLAYAVLWCILDQAELANIAVRPEARGRGVGSALLDHILEVARERSVQSVFLEVRESNHVARELYARRGFVEVGVRRGYYDVPREDARVLELRL
ncbi:MAG TPA: ribosomal protein S18-alanine N-acetyltransferase [Longimicrobiales bacterium]|nr:ribosomal protein S18-alanine N-acetyltransferase [Longimicrobiales bacterium]